MTYAERRAEARHKIRKRRDARLHLLYFGFEEILSDGGGRMEFLDESLHMRGRNVEIIE